jgi:ABC-2 type transport system permease protein
MKKIWVIARKDLSILFADRSALILLLAAPFLLSLGIAAVTGAFSGGGSGGLRDIPVLVINYDRGPFGAAVIDVLTNERLEGLFKVTETSDEGDARRQMEEDQSAGAVIIPTGFSAGILPDPNTGLPGALVEVEVYTNPVRPISSQILQAVIIEAVHGFETAALIGDHSVPKIMVQRPAGPKNEESEPVHLMAYLAPAMAVFFLMFTATQGGRSLLAERDMGTLPRLLATPTNRVQILAGKVLGVFISGFIQVSVLVFAAAILFGLNWGNPMGVIILIIGGAAAATGWGILLASIAKTPFQVSSIGSAMTLIFGILGGSFIPVSEFSGPARLISRLTPNAWTLDGFQKLAEGGSLADISLQIASLTAMAVVLFIISVLLSRRRWASGFMQS